MKNNRVLIVSSFFPYPSYFGGSFDVLERAKGLKKLGFEIDLVCTCKIPPENEHVAFMKSIVNDIIIVERKNKLIHFFSRKPLQVLSRKSIKNIQLQLKYSFVILETEYVGAILENETLKAEKIFLRVQNNESAYFKELSQSTMNPLKKIYYLTDSLKFYWYSNHIFKKVDKLWYISSLEINANENNFNKSVHLPAPINEKFVKRELTSKKILFIGSLFMPNNFEGLEWYLKNIHPKLCAEIEEYVLIIVGSTGGISENYFHEKLKKYKKLEVHFNVKDLTKFYSESSIFINPMLHGAGVKIKTINAVVNGLPIVSTTKGAEGIGIVDKQMYFKADSPIDFKNAILNIFNLKNSDKQVLVKQAQNYLEKNNYLNILKKELVND